MVFNVITSVLISVVIVINSNFVIVEAVEDVDVQMEATKCCESLQKKDRDDEDDEDDDEDGDEDDDDDEEEDDEEDMLSKD